MFKSFIVSALIVIVILISGCMSAADHQRALHSSQEREMTVGIVQKVKVPDPQNPSFSWFSAYVYATFK